MSASDLASLDDPPQEAQLIAIRLMARWMVREREMRARPSIPDPRNPEYSVTSPRSAAIARCCAELAEAFDIPMP